MQILTLYFTKFSFIFKTIFKRKYHFDEVFSQGEIKEHSLPLVQPCFICVIYAEQMLGTLMSVVQDNSTYGTYKKLVAGVALNEKKIYISSDDQTGDLELMRKMLLNMFKESVYKISL